MSAGINMITSLLYFLIEEQKGGLGDRRTVGGIVKRCPLFFHLQAEENE